MLVINRVRNAPKWEIVMPGSKPGRPHRRVPHPVVTHPYAKLGTGRIAAIFAGGSAVILGAGVALMQSGALPEIATGITAARLGDNQLVMGDIFGGNAFQVCLFLLADVLAGKATLAAAGAQNSWLAGLGILVTMVYATSVIVRPEKNHLRVGIDSIIVLVLIVIGMVGLGRIPG
jgi:cation:H+ antiporter